MSEALYNHIQKNTLSTRKINTLLIDNILNNNKIFIDYYLKYKDTLKLVCLNKGEVTEDLQRVIAEGNYIIFTDDHSEEMMNTFQPVKVLDYDVVTKVSKTNRYTQKNLNVLNYQTVKENLAKHEEYAISVGEGLTYHITKNNLYIQINSFIDPSKSYISKLDYILAFNPLVQELTALEKRALVQGQFLKELEAIWEKEAVIREIDKIKTYAQKTILENLDRRESELINELRNAQEQVDIIYGKMVDFRTTKLKTLTTNTDIKFERFMEFLKRSPLVKNVSTRQASLEEYAVDIYTNPIYIVNWNKDMTVRYLPNLEMSSNHKDAVKKALIDETALIGVGLYRINIKFRRADITFGIEKRSSNYRNQHWTDYTCLGSFANPISEAKASYDPFTLINLLFQYIQTLNVGDSAGNKTLYNTSYVLDKATRTVIYTPNSSHNGKKEEELF